MDFRNDFDNDQNIIIYGHYVYPEKWDDEDICFTYLHELKDKNNSLIYARVSNRNIINFYKNIIIFKWLSPVNTGNSHLFRILVNKSNSTEITL